MNAVFFTVDYSSHIFFHAFDFRLFKITDEYGILHSHPVAFEAFPEFVSPAVVRDVISGYDEHVLSSQMKGLYSAGFFSSALARDNACSVKAFLKDLFSSLQQS